MKSGIYKITNIVTGKVYVGSSINIDGRWNDHKNQLKANKHHSIKLQRSFNKHGANNFLYEIIELCDNKLLIVKEQYYLDLLQPEYNICKIAGSCLGIVRTEEYKQKMSNSLKGRVSPMKGSKHTEESKLKMSKSGKGVKRTEETKRKISESKKGEKHPMYGKKVKEENKTYKKIKQLTKGHEFIRNWDSLTECAKFLNTTIDCISKVLGGRRKSHLGFIFEYL